MANARVLMEVRIVGQEGDRTIEIARPGKTLWTVVLPAGLVRGAAVPVLADYVTAQYLVELPMESIRLGWETIYALVRVALLEAEEMADELLTGTRLPVSPRQSTPTTSR